MAFLTGFAISASGSDSLVGPLTLPRVLDFSLAHSPEVAAGLYEVGILEGEVLQARLLANPELGLEVENLDADGALSGESRQLTAQLTQTVDPGRISRASRVSREKELAQLEFQALVQRVRTRVRQQFVSLLAAQERIALSRELVHLSAAAHGLAVEKVRSGKASPTDSLQSQVALSLARIDSGKAAGELSLVRRGLATACGLSGTSFDSAQGHLGPVSAVPDWESLAARLPGSPEWNLGDFEAKVRDADIRAEKTARIPPVTLEAGIRQVPEKAGRAFVAGISLPLPLWDWNQGAIRSAKARKAKSGERGRMQRLDLVERLAGAHGRALTSYREAGALAGQVLPAATATFAGVQEAYRVGKFGSLDVLNAQKALFEARSRYLDARTAHHLAVVEWEEILGGGFAALQPEKDARP